MEIDKLFTYDFSTTVWILAAAMMVAALYLLCFFVPSLTRVRRRVADDSMAPLPEHGYPEVSVVIYANNNGDNIGALLDDIFAQDYPADYEVIVVTDGSYDSTERIVGELQLSHTNLYLTFTPEHSRNLSRRKLSITLGVKAARFDNVLLTCANCRPDSNQWMKRMMRHFVNGQKLVAGFAHIAPRSDSSGAMRTRAFDYMWESVSWLSPAVLGYPHRGVGYNLAYSRQLFFENKGFSKTLNLNYGDDDIFVSEIATRRNAVVELSPESQVTVDDIDPSQMHRLNKLRRHFTSGIMGGWFKRWMSLASWSVWAMIGTAVALSIIGLPSIIPAIAAFIVVVATLLTLAIIWRSTAKSLAIRALFLTVTPLMLWHPFYEMRYAIKGWRTRRRNFTWSN